MNSRLDRLFLLLEQGSNLTTKKAAALQLGEVQKVHPHEYHTLLNRLREYLHSNNWDTRIAAACAVEAIVKHVPKYFPSGKCNKDGESSSIIYEDLNTYISFEQFELDTIIKNGRQLLGSEGNEYDIAASDLKSSDRLLEQRKLINQRLGLDLAEKFGVDSQDIICNEDLENLSSVSIKSENDEIQHPLKRSINDEIALKRIKLDLDTISKNNTNLWPLRKFTEQLMNDIFSANWEVRHGSGTALREIIKEHGQSARQIAQTSSDLIEQLNQRWLEDCSLRLICVLALDKFGDFLSDQVVAPVRETCAQVLGAIFKFFTQENMIKSLTVLLKLLKRPEWEARHGALLSIKYALAVRQDMTEQILPLVFEAVFTSLRDSVDDVSAVAASTFVPVKEKLFEVMPQQVKPLIKYLWDVLLDMDELNSSTNNLLELLSSLLSQCVQKDHEQLNLLIPRLWPFLDHSLSSVRKSVLEAFIVLVESESSLDWMCVELLSNSLRLIFQRALVEESSVIQNLLNRAWLAIISHAGANRLLASSCAYLSGWICLLMHPSRVAIDSNVNAVWLDLDKCYPNAEKRVSTISQVSSSKRYFIGGVDNVSTACPLRKESITNARFRSSSLIARLAYHLLQAEVTNEPSALDSLVSILLFHLSSKSAVQRTCTAWIVKDWAAVRKEYGQVTEPLPNTLIEKMFFCVNEMLYFDEIASSFTRIQHETREFVNAVCSHSIPLDSQFLKPNAIYPLIQIGELVEKAYADAISRTTGVTQKILGELDVKRKNLHKSFLQLTKHQSELTITCSAAIASALIAWGFTPEKLNPVVRPLMDSVKRENNITLQLSSAQHLALLLDICVTRNPQPIPKIVKNLVTFLCSDNNFTPVIEKESVQNELITLMNMQKKCEARTFRRSVSGTVKKEIGEEVLEITNTVNLNEEQDKEKETYRKGAAFALTEIVSFFGDAIPEKVAPLWEYIESIQQLANDSSFEQVQKLRNSLQLLEIIAPCLSSTLQEKIKIIFLSLCECLRSPYSQIRHLTARCFGQLACIQTESIIELVLEHVLPMLEVSENDTHRKGAVECIYHIIERLEINVVPFISFLVLPMLGRMSDQNEEVRLLGTLCFAQLIKLMPLENESNCQINSEKLKQQKKEGNCLEQLLDPRKLRPYNLPIPVKAELRTYQQEGLNWLAFLNTYKLHGILCDEMGLGKTMMSICILASDHYKRSLENNTELPSLVVCPSTLTAHWTHEVSKFVDSKYIRPLLYRGTVAERHAIRNQLQISLKAHILKHNLVVASYDIVRNDIEFFSSISWNYCILDEGHIIKNSKTKITRAIKSLNAYHRLILSGTPIQNNVLELWSLFDFLMPGYLGNEKQFQWRYSKPILASRDAKSSSKEQEAGILAMEGLHAQVLPFILRRMKEDVLKDLPPKIIQDYYCELSALQTQLYEDFARSSARKSLEQSFNKDEKKDEQPVLQAHVFQALQYLRRVCNHPKMVLTESHPEHSAICAKLKEQKSSLNDITHSAKLIALRQLLLDCGVGTQGGSSLTNEPIVSPHRALVFCQMKNMLDIIEHDLLKKNMPTATYMRLDGSVPIIHRQSIVDRFNNDPSIDILLLTTQVGGLGLNLTGADVVIFVEHDWNPMKDLQAMDRAHRIGQKKVVNVYRLITANTLEEKIMGLQKFKMQVANTVISPENASLQTMETDHLLDLFHIEQNNKDKSTSNTSKGMKAILAGLPEMWDDEQYEKEYNLNEFLQTLKHE